MVLPLSIFLVLLKQGWYQTIKYINPWCLQFEVEISKKFSKIVRNLYLKMKIYLIVIIHCSFELLWNQFYFKNHYFVLCILYFLLKKVFVNNRISLSCKQIKQSNVSQNNFLKFEKCCLVKKYKICTKFFFFK